MTEPRDERLLDELRTVLNRYVGQPVSRFEDLLAFAGSGQALAHLLDPPAAEPAGVRGSVDATGVLVFEVGDGSLAVEVVVTRDRLDGQVLAGDPVEVVLERISGPARACPVDDLGRFAFARPLSGPASGPGRLRLRGGPTGPVATDWFLL